MEIYTKPSAIFLVIFMAGCASSETIHQINQENKSQPEEITVPERHLDDIVDRNRSAFELSDYLIRVPGIYVQGGGNHVRVTIRGPSSFLLSTEPLFVINGQIIGRDYNRVRNSIDVHEIARVRVLKGTKASIYGVQGANGVILIETKWHSNKPVIE